MRCREHPASARHAHVSVLQRSPHGRAQPAATCLMLATCPGAWQHSSPHPGPDRSRHSWQHACPSAGPAQPASGCCRSTAPCGQHWQQRLLCHHHRLACAQQCHGVPSWMHNRLQACMPMAQESDQALLCFGWPPGVLTQALLVMCLCPTVQRPARPAHCLHVPLCASDQHY